MVLLKELTKKKSATLNFRMSKRIIIIGAEGFIGSNLCRYLYEKGYEVWGVDIVSLQIPSFYNYIQLAEGSADLETLFSQQKFEYCINAAGKGDVGFSISHPLKDFEANTLHVARILDAMRITNNSCKYIHISSAAVYGNPLQLPVKEEDDLNPLSPYGYHKLMSEITCKEYFHLYNLPIAILRPFSVYGNGLKKQLFWDICKKLKQDNDIRLFGTGNETRDFIYIDDLLQLIKVIIDKSPFECNIYNAANGTETEIKQIAKLFVDHFPGKKKISFSGELKKGDPLNWKADISKVKQLGFMAESNLENNVIDYINWFCSLANE